MNSSRTLCNGDCPHCPARLAAVPENSAKDTLNVAVVGCDEKGVSALARSLQSEASCLHTLSIVTSAQPCPDALLNADVILQLADAMNLEEGFMQTTHMMDTGCRMVLVLDRYAELLASDHSLDFQTLGIILGFPVLPLADGPRAIASAIRRIAADALWLPKSIQGRHIDEEEHARRGFVTGALQETLKHGSDRSNHSLAQKVDALLTNRWLGLPLLLLILFLVFNLTFALGSYPQAWIEAGVDSLSRSVAGALPPGWLSSLLSDGIIRGVGAVVSFLPNIIILFIFLSLLEDSGYMARAAYIMDKIMHRIGLHGNSFVPMIIGFGCNVPAIMAARSIQNRRDRALTMLMIPFMSCSARLPVYMLLVSAFFVRCKALVMISIYILGILVSIAFAFVMKRTRWFRKGNEDYVSELPPFHLPHVKDTASHIWERVADYLKKITTVILAASVIIWALEYFPTHDGVRAESDASYLAAIGHAMEPVMSPLGFDWRMNVCILTGLPAKEAIVSTMGILYHTGDQGSLVSALQASDVFNPAVALAFMVYVLLYFPCVATIATIRREVSRKWAVFTVINSLCLAWLLAFLAFRLFTVLL